MRCVAVFFLSLLAALAPLTPVLAGPRIKDIVDIEGVRDNLLVGYGLVIGLNGTGDNLNVAPFTQESLESFLERLGVNARDVPANTENVAAVIVTANLPPFATQGTRIDVTVSALADAESLMGGTLVLTPLLADDGQVYAVAQGPIAIGGFAAGGQSGSSVTQGVPTSGRIANGAIVEREVRFDFAGLKEIRLALRNPDITTANRVAAKVNTALVDPTAARALNPSMVALRLPAGYTGDMVGLLAMVEGLEVETDHQARIVIDETTGVIVLNDNVRVSRVAIAQGNLTISVQERPQVSQPAPLSEGETVVVPDSEVTVEEERNGLAVVENGASLKELVDGLNALGVTPRDMISILQALKAAGAIQAQIQVL
ncbi:MAG TPA: flagellar biosynthesis protein FlgA [Hyphomonadaceae bacterium]|jgi:Flagellar basal-body P-ring protein|nr:flagellar biosynthesis protein FlgA [Hyphomonadaceae bacterium]